MPTLIGAGLCLMAAALILLSLIAQSNQNKNRH
ncbi:hypothetical protein AAY80_147 [Stenotrophomonas phage vB_SmaS-DLP_6]|nr:hypothetical protein AAY80_147 [Stenotrophomonas phage vB_SmaS-DLP_6]